MKQKFLTSANPNLDANPNPIPNLDRNPNPIPNPDRNPNPIPNPDRNPNLISNLVNHIVINYISYKYVFGEIT